MSIKKIAVLGGGIGSLTSIYQLTSDPDWKSKYEITLYHMGWRLGGKGVSGRNQQEADRIEEHGLHLWFGFYDNAFNMIQQCYKDNNRPAGAPLATWEEAFTGYNMICLEEKIKGKWLHWPFKIPTNKATPGIGDAHPKPTEYVYKLLEWLKTIHKDYHDEKSEKVKSKIDEHKNSEHHSLIKDILDDVVKRGEHMFHDVGAYMIHGALKLASKNNHGLLNNILVKFKHWLEFIAKGLVDSDNKLRRYFIIADLVVIHIIGMIKDKVITEGFDIINDIDYREWLIKHNAAEISYNSALVQGVYGLVFGGDKQYTFEAGVALRGLLRMGLTYKGHVYYRMMAGMGDVITAPMYEVLIKRGVKIEYFNRITDIALDSTKQNISTITIDVQASLKPEYDIYNPLINVKGLPSWPSEPLYEQLVQGDELQSKNINLESYYQEWDSGIPNNVLKVGIDFDEVILGISIGGLWTVAKELIDNSTAWQNMMANVIPISTIAYQMWLKPDATDLGWPYVKDGLGLLGSYQEPYDTYCDMTDLIERESWPEDHKPKSIAYFCGPAPEPNAEEIWQNVKDSNFINSNFPQEQSEMAKQHAQNYIQKLTPHIWPKIWEGQESFDYNQLVDLKDEAGEQRFDSQFFRANIDPTELYVMSFVNSSKYRIKTDETGYDNLYITGDWIDNGFNAGCIEATVMSGLQTARAVSGEDFKIPGENDF
ncbi:NAD(P)-binding protein [Winogradskyella ursingii]|uniref:NAD(P)-binding protein n=1 Tax=Winogradskyella ursingii TaxID=2686079 RepID=UPI0015C75A62|nr:NAD(P)-binding protein [Winogradskyella ursingii]